MPVKTPKVLPINLDRKYCSEPPNKKFNNLRANNKTGSDNKKITASAAAIPAGFVGQLRPIDSADQPTLAVAGPQNSKAATTTNKRLNCWLKPRPKPAAKPKPSTQRPIQSMG